MSWWAVQFSVSFFDFVAMYVLTHAMLKRSITFNLKHVALAVLYTVTVAPLYLYDPYALRVVATLLIFFMIKFVSKRGLGDIMIIYGLAAAIFMIIQVLMLAIVWPLHEFLNFERPLIFLIAQLLTTGVTVFVCKKLKLNQWFYALQINPVLKLGVFILALLIFVALFILNFEYRFTYLIFFALAILFVLVSLFPIFIKLYNNSIGLISVHDFKNSLLSTAIAIASTDDINEVRRLFSEHAKAFGMDVSQLDVGIIEDQMEQEEANRENIESFINQKLYEHKKDIKIISDINYNKPHYAVELSLALKWLGTLLDNALEASVDKPIYIDIFSIRDDFALQVANEYVGETQNIQLIFERGYSTKDSGRGIGLHNVHTQVTELGGVVEASTQFTEAHNCHYLSINIMFKYNPYESLKLQKEGKVG